MKFRVCLPSKVIAGVEFKYVIKIKPMFQETFNVKRSAADGLSKLIWHKNTHQRGYLLPDETTGIYFEI